jgi:hypothetical protein
MPGSIQEIPLDNPDIAQPIEDNAQSIRDIVAEFPEGPVPEEVKPIKPRAKGRPKGSCNKGPSKPGAQKASTQGTLAEAPIEYEPSSPKRNLKLPTDPSTSDVAAAKLKLLQKQSLSTQARKQRLHNSWLQPNLLH